MENEMGNSHNIWNPLCTTISQEQIDAYLKKLESSGYSSSTLQSYRRSLERLYRFLPEDKLIQPGSLALWQAHLQESGLSVKAANIATTAANGLMLHLGHRELQAGRAPEAEAGDQPALTRVEYLRLLSTARQLNKERAYLLVKLFGTTGLAVGELEYLTVDAVQARTVALSSGSLQLPHGLQKELLHFIQGEGISSGPVFLSRGGKPQDRTVVTAMIQALCRDARVPEEKGTPRCLGKLYRTTMGEIEKDISILIEQVYNRLLEKEQEAIGW